MMSRCAEGFVLETKGHEYRGVLHRLTRLSNYLRLHPTSRRKRDRFGAVADTKLRKQVAHMMRSRPATDVESIRDFLIREARGQK
jgi:hypothetical protein